jgi:D-amino-acid dehydrogenase
MRDLHLASRAGFEEWATGFGDDFGFTKNGILMLCRTEHGLEEEVRIAEHARRMEIPAEQLTPEQAARLEPGIRMSVAGAVYYPLDCHLDPARLMAALQRETEKAGVRLDWETQVLGWRHGGGRIEAMVTSRGEMIADEHVVCAGAWSSAMARDLGVALPMEAGRGYNLTLREPARMPRVALILSEARVAVTPMGGALRFAGTMELAGLDESVNPARVRGIVKSVAESLPEFGRDAFRDAPVWCGLRPCSPDGLPYVGRFGRYANLSTATGHGMMGVSLAPITARLVAEILEEKAPSIDIGLLSPDRFARG